MSSDVQMGLFLASLGMAFATVFLPWFRVRYGAIGLAVSVALWLAYEATIPTQVNIRIDLVVLFPFLAAALVSTVIAAIGAGREGSGESKAPRSRRRISPWRGPASGAPRRCRAR